MPDYRDPIQVPYDSVVSEEEQKVRNSKNRRRVVLSVLDYTHRKGDGAGEFVHLVDSLGLEEELEGLLKGDLRRRERVAEARIGNGLPE